MRLRNDPQAKTILAQSDLVKHHLPIELNQTTIVEIGMGKGEMLIQMAFEQPKMQFIGIEKYATVALKALKKAQKLNLQNFFIVNQDLAQIGQNFQGQAKEIWLTFPDPWPKKGHYKRRLTYEFFLAIYKQILMPGGLLKFKTDNDFLFQWSISTIANFGAKIVYLTTNLQASSRAKTNIMTGYETKWTRQGKAINYMEIRFD